MTTLAARYTPSTTVYRVAYRYPTELPPWKFVGGGRFDDPQESYRVLYTSLTEVGACIERFQDHRPVREFADVEAEFELDGSIDEAMPEVPTGRVLFESYATLFLGRLALPQDSELADLTVDASARHLSTEFKRNLTVADLVADRRPYAVTQHASRIGFMDPRSLAGIYSASKIDPVETQNVTLYEGDAGQLRVLVRAERVESLSIATPALGEAADALGIVLEAPDEFFARGVRERGV